MGSFLPNLGSRRQLQPTAADFVRKRSGGPINWRCWKKKLWLALTACMKVKLRRRLISRARYRRWQDKLERVRNGQPRHQGIRHGSGTLSLFVLVYSRDNLAIAHREKHTEETLKLDTRMRSWKRKTILTKTNCCYPNVPSSLPSIHASEEKTF